MTFGQEKGEKKCWARSDIWLENKRQLGRVPTPNLVNEEAVNTEKKMPIWYFSLFFLRRVSEKKSFHCPTKLPARYGLVSRLNSYQNDYVVYDCVRVWFHYITFLRLTTKHFFTLTDQRGWLVVFFKSEERIGFSYLFFLIFVSRGK